MTFFKIKNRITLKWETPSGRISLDLSREFSGEKLDVVDKDGNAVGELSYKIKPQELSDNVKAKKTSPCSGCGGEKIEPPRTPEDNEAILRDGIV